MKFSYVRNVGTLGAFCRCSVTALVSLALAIGVIRAEAEETGSLRVAMSGQYMPLHGEEDGKKVGFEVDIAYLLGKHLGKQVVFLSRSDLGTGTLQAVAEGKADIGLSAITPTSDRRKIVDFSRPIGAVRYLVVHDGSTNACEKEVLAAQGPAYEAAKKALGNAAKSCQDDMAAIQMLQAGKARCTVVEEPSIAKNLPNPGNLKVLKTPVGESPIAIAVPKGKQREIDELLSQWSVGAYVGQFQDKWNIQSTNASEAWILPYAEWPAEIKTAWVPAPDFGMRYLRELREAYKADRLRQAVRDLTKGADQTRTAAVVDSLIKLAEENPIVLGTLVELKIASRTSPEAKRHLVAILYTYLQTTRVPYFETISAIATSILEANATSYVDLYQLSKSLCGRGLRNSTTSGAEFDATYSTYLHKLLEAVFKQSPKGALVSVLLDYYQSCMHDYPSEGEPEEGYLFYDPMTYTLARIDDWRFTEEVVRKLLQEAVTVNGYEVLEHAEQIARFNTKLTKSLTPLINEAREQIEKEKRLREDEQRAADARARAAFEAQKKGKGPR